MNTTDKIRSMMNRNGLNQSQMARLLGIPQAPMGNWLGGGRTPPSVAARLVQVLEQAEMFYPSLFKGLVLAAMKPAA